MTAKELFELCTTTTTDCSNCPYKDSEAECKVVVDAIHMMRHPQWYVKKPKVEAFRQHDEISTIRKEDRNETKQLNKLCSSSFEL